MTDLQSDGTERDGDGTRRSVALPADVVERVEARVRATDFGSADEYVTFVLRETLARVEAAADDDTSAAVTEAEVESRLESLGYLE